MKIFLLTRLSRGATNKIMIYGLYTMISTHAPLARRDLIFLSSLLNGSRFLLTRLSRGATVASDDFYLDLDISTHAPLARRD